MKSGVDGARLLLIGGKPLNEKIAWHGPIVMNTDEEIEVAFEEFYAGNFIKYKPQL
jgi:redox-sensitive bicupin YhaK (pirin superfamily)